MTLRSYISRIESILFSRRDLVIESWGVLLVGAGAKLEGIVCFEDGSKLFLTERLRPTGLRDPERSFFKYHYQNADESLVFRYDHMINRRTIPYLQLFHRTSTRPTTWSRPNRPTWWMYCVRSMRFVTINQKGASKGSYAAGAMTTDQRLRGFVSGSANQSVSPKIRGHRVELQPLGSGGASQSVSPKIRGHKVPSLILNTPKSKTA